MAKALSLWGDPLFRRSTASRFDNLFDDIFRYDYHPQSSRDKKVKVTETDTSYDISILAPGRDKADFNVSLENSCIRVFLESTESNEHEFVQDAFDYSWRAPKNITIEDVSAEYEAGILKVVITKPTDEQSVAQTIQVK
tara:strand:- start:399 stop:815 length:417 start_codon:yes stop_codon:yes gene_type:complete